MTYVRTPITVIAIIAIIGVVSAQHLEFKDITKIAYSKDVYIEYVEGRPVFYIDQPTPYVFKPVKVCTELNISGLGFVNDCTDYDVKLVVGEGVKKERYTKIVWMNDPLSIGSVEVHALYNLPNYGEILAKYEDGGNAVIRVGKIIYIGFEPREDCLANILTAVSIKEVKKDFYWHTIFLFIPIALIITHKGLRKFVELLSLLIVVDDAERVLLNDMRRRIYEYILDNPGIHLREIARDLNISISTATWHLRILERANLIRSEKVGNKIIYIPTGMEKEDLMIALTINNENAKRIVEYLMNEEAHARKIARDLNMNIETVRYHLKRLERAGVVVSKEDGKRIVYSINWAILSL